MRNALVSALVSLAALLALVAAAQPARNSTISGHVLNASTGEPLRRAAVTIFMENRSDVRGMAPTDDDGQFLLRALPAGRYRLEVSKRGYSAMNYGARRPGSPGQIVTLGPNENKSGLLIRLPRLSAISGSIFDAAGLPAISGAVTAYRLTASDSIRAWRFESEVRLDNRGMYHLSGLPPGRYLVAAQLDPPRRLPPNSDPDLPPVPIKTYYPATLLQAEASPLELRSGAEISDVAINVREVRPCRIGLQVLLPPSLEITGAPPRFDVTLNDDLHTFYTVTASDSAQADRLWVTRTMAPDTYVFTTLDSFGGKRYFATQSVDLTGGQAEVTLALKPGVDLRGRIRFDGPAHTDITRLRVQLQYPPSPRTRIDSGPISPNGSFVISDVPPTTWRLIVGSLPAGTFLKSATLGTLDLLANPLPVTPTLRELMEIVIGTRPARLAGHIQEGVATVVLAVPQGELAHHPGAYSVVGVDEQNGFEFEALPPGTYRIYAFDQLRPSAWLDPGFLKDYTGTAVNLVEGPAPPLMLRAETATPVEP